MSNKPVLIIIDDDSDFQELLRLTLKEFTVLSIETPAEFHELLKTSPIASGIILDNDIKGLGAKDMVGIIDESSLKGVPKVLISGHHNCRKISEELLMNGFFEKPVSLKKVRAHMYELLEMNV